METVLHASPPAPSSAVQARAPLRCVHELVVEHARTAPGSIAVVDGEHRVTYGELEMTSRRIAARLRALGVAQEQLVALCADRCATWIASWLGILRAGAAYVALDS